MLNMRIGFKMNLIQHFFLQVEEISGVAFIFNQKFFNDLNEAKGIALENIVYYKDETHYFVMTAKKQSLLNKGIVLKKIIKKYDYVIHKLLFGDFYGSRN